MIISTGIDIVEVYRIREAMTRTPRFRERVFTEAEQSYCDARGAAAFQSFAARFAAKEAMLKALKTGWSGAIAWRDVEVRIAEDGSPFIRLFGEAEKLFRMSGADTVHLALSHTSEHAIAQVILEKTG